MASSAPSADWQELLQAIDFASERLVEWGRDRKISLAAAQAIATAYATYRDFVAEAARRGDPMPPEMRVPPLPAGPSAAARALRSWQILEIEVQRLERDGLLPLAEAHGCLNEARERIAFLRRKLDQPADDDTSPTPAEAPPLVTAVPELPRRSLMELMLDPRAIQWFLAFGGGLFVFGLVLWLYTIGIFQDKLVVAVCLGTANAALLTGGWALIQRTRYQLAGRALTLLACLVMPLNLWFYHAQDLITLEGHLWIAGVVVCALYAASAWALKDWMFVPVFMGGVTMTGLLLLEHLGTFWEIAAPSTFLVALGLIGIHVERAFVPDDGPFARRRFGLAFFFSGHALLAGGLLLLLGAQIGGHWLQPFFAETYRQLDAVPSPIVTEQWGQLLALALVAAGVYGYLYSDLVVRRLGVYIALAAAGLLWAEVLLLELLHIDVGVEIILSTLSLTALIANLAVAYGPWTGLRTDQSAFRVPRSTILALCLALVPVVFGIVLHVRATNTLLSLWQHDGGWAYVGAMAIAAVSCRVAAHVYRNTLPVLTAIYFFATAAAEMAGAAGLLRQIGLVGWEDQAWLLMVIPLGYSLAADLYRGRAWATPVLAAGHAATAVMLVSSLATTTTSFTTVHSGEMLNLTLAGFFLLAGMFYLLAATWHKQPSGVYLATVMGCASVWQLLLYLGVAAEYYSFAFAGLGLLLLMGYRLGGKEKSAFGRSKAVFDSANGLLSAAFVSGGLLSLQRLSLHNIHWPFVGLCAALTIVTLLAAGLVRHSGWRRWYVVMAIIQGLLTLLAVERLSTLTAWQKAELFSIVAGTALVVIGLLGWFREQERDSDFVSFCLTLGSFLVGVPLAVAVLYHRSQPHFSWPNELGLLAGGLVLLGAGFVCQLRAPTLVGSGMVAVYVVTLLLYARGLLEEMETAAMLMAIGGGLIFVIGLVLAFYRDRLLTLPERYRQRQGLFRVLNWR